MNCWPDVGEGIFKRFFLRLICSSTQHWFYEPNISSKSDVSHSIGQGYVRYLQYKFKGMKTILVATDYSESAESALKYAAFIASFTKADVILFNNYSPDIHALNGLITANALDVLVRKNKEHLEKYAENLSLKYNRPLKTYTLSSMTTESLEGLIDKTGANLVVMGLKKSTQGEYHISGMTSEIVIKNTRVPVLVVPEQVELKMPERILYACDYQALPKDDHLNVLKEVAKAFGSELQVFHVYKNETIVAAEQELKESFLVEIESAMSNLDHTYHNLKAKNFIEGLKKGIKDFNADILVMSPHKYGFWSSLIHKSKTREMILNSEIPLLSIPS